MSLINLLFDEYIACILLNIIDTLILLIYVGLLTLLSGVKVFTHKLLCKDFINQLLTITIYREKY